MVWFSPNLPGNLSGNGLLMCYNNASGVRVWDGGVPEAVRHPEAVHITETR